MTFDMQSILLPLDQFKILLISKAYPPLFHFFYPGIAVVAVTSLLPDFWTTASGYVVSYNLLSAEIKLYKKLILLC